ncbi:hypothetical protein ONZ45_g17673 [Pleurotus djamor]|nr:hypothetical protein ONZ45_g17673 [Pleurotus djamor]
MSSSLPQRILEELGKIDAGAEFSGSMPHIRSSSGAHYFVKLGSVSEAEQYTGEVESLQVMADAAPGLAPRVISFGIDHSSGRPIFISQYMDLTQLSDAAARKLGKRLASEMHAFESSHGYGFGVPTYCGATRLQNGWFDSWDECYSAMIDDLLTQLKGTGRYPELIRSGQLSGNTGMDKDGQPIIYDPASFFGHNEADLAIGRMFGGIPRSFYDEYHKHLPKTEPVNEYEARGQLYQLFHYLNHTLLFGGSYSGSALSIMKTLLATTN